MFGHVHSGIVQVMLRMLKVCCVGTVDSVESPSFLKNDEHLEK